MEEPVRSRPIIRVRKLRKVYRIGDEKVVALGNINLEIMQGQIVCIVGTSGSGKSTLLNQLAGLEKPTRGAVYIGKTNISALSENQLAVFRQNYLGFVFQSYNLLSTLTALENVALPMIFRGISRLRRNKAALSMLAAVGLKRRAHHRPTQMSGGQQQRVGIARAFVTRPKVIFADEPTGNLDTKTTIAVMRMMVRFARKYKQTLIIVTHDPELSAYADRVVTLIDGAITSDVARVSICDSEGNILGEGEAEPPDPAMLPQADPLESEVLPDSDEDEASDEEDEAENEDGDAAAEEYEADSEEGKAVADEEGEAENEDGEATAEDDESDNQEGQAIDEEDEYADKTDELSDEPLTAEIDEAVIRETDYREINTEETGKVEADEASGDEPDPAAGEATEAGNDSEPEAGESSAGVAPLLSRQTAEDIPPDADAPDAKLSDTL